MFNASVLLPAGHRSPHFPSVLEAGQTWAILPGGSCSPAAPQGLGQTIQTGTIPTPPGPSWAAEGPTCQNCSLIPSAFGIIPPENQPGPTESQS